MVFSLGTDPPDGYEYLGKGKIKDPEGKIVSPISSANSKVVLTILETLAGVLLSFPEERFSASEIERAWRLLFSGNLCTRSSVTPEGSNMMQALLKRYSSQT